MSKVYTFPNQETLSGTVIIYVTTSTGSGSETLTDKYFSDEVVITNETERLAGELRFSSAEFTIAYDKNDLFRSTILPVALDPNEFVSVRIALDSATIYEGKIEPSTIAYDPFYAENDNLDGQKTAIRFRCNSLLSLLKTITKDTLVSSLANYITTVGRYVLIAGEGVDQYYYYATFRDLVDRIFYLLSTTAGLTYSITYSLTDWTFYSKGNGAEDAEYIYPSIAKRGDINYSKFGSDSEPSIMVGTSSPATGEPVGDLTYVGLFATDDETFITAYDYLAGFLKSFGLYCDIQHTPSVDLLVTIGTRSSGELVNTSDVLDVQELPMVEIARKKVNVTSLLSGNSYVKDFPNMGTSEFSLQTVYDFGNDLDFPGGTDSVNTVKSVMMPKDGTHFELARYIGIGEGYLLNPNLDQSIDSWTAGGSWVFDASSPFTFGSARATLTSATGVELYQDIPVEIKDGVIFGGKFRANDNDNLTTIKIYSGSTVVKSETFQLQADIKYMLYAVIDSKFVKQVTGQPITRVGISVRYFSSPNALGYVWFAYSFLQRMRKGTPELVGSQIEDLFNDVNLSREQRTLNGMQLMKPSDYYDDNGERFYYKKVTWKLRDYETEVESINYPY